MTTNISMRADLSAAQRDLEDIAERASDLTPAMAAVAEELRRFVETRFATRTDPNGQPWAPLKSESKDRGALRRSVFATGTDTTVSYGATTGWAAYHQTGTETTPARPFLPSDETESGPAAELWSRIERIIAQHVAPDASDDEG